MRAGRQGSGGELDLRLHHGHVHHDHLLDVLRAHEVPTGDGRYAVKAVRHVHVHGCRLLHPRQHHHRLVQHVQRAQRRAGG